MARIATQSHPGYAQSKTGYKFGLIGSGGHCDVVVDAPWGGGAATAPVTGPFSVKTADVCCGTPAKLPSRQYLNGASALAAPILPLPWQQCGSKVQLCVFWTDLIATGRSRASSGLALPHPGSVSPAVDFVRSKFTLDRTLRRSSHSSRTPR